jgi:hypothetical protein
VSACDTGDGSGWFWWAVARTWAACATGNDAGGKPKPSRVVGTEAQRH